MEEKLRTDDTQPMRRVLQDDTTRRHQPLVLEQTARLERTRRLEPMEIKPTPPPRRCRRPSRLFGCLARGGMIVLLSVLVLTAVGLATYWIAPPPRMNVLILGLDAREGQGTTALTDTMILATVNPAQPYVGMLSIPRDLFISIPGYGMNRINAAHFLGEAYDPGSGMQLAAQTVEQTFGVPVDRTIRLDFEAFVAIIDAAGGVDIDVAESFADYSYPTPDYGTRVVTFEAGEQHVDGQRALEYARVRHGSSDFSRVERQQQILEALMCKLVLPWNWWRLPTVGAAIAQHVDTDMTAYDLVALAPAVLWVGPDSVDRRVFTPDMAPYATTNQGWSVVEPNWPLINPVLMEMFGQ